VAASAREEADNLRRALDNSRVIGTAMGVLMSARKLTSTQAFDLLRTASQHSNRKLAEIAAEVAETGTLDRPNRTDSRRRS
jgi:AmiR/NasT family two-component response regulator